MVGRRGEGVIRERGEEEMLLVSDGVGRGGIKYLWFLEVPL